MRRLREQASNFTCNDRYLFWHELAKWRGLSVSTDASSGSADVEALMGQIK